MQIISSVCFTSMSGTMIYERRKLFIGRAMILMSVSGIGNYGFASLNATLCN